MSAPKRIATAAAAATAAASLLAVAPLAQAPAQAASKVYAKDGARAQLLRQAVVRIAKAQRGDNYVFGAEGPNAFDCSGLVVYAYRKATGARLPHSSSAQMRSITHVRKRDRMIGDVVFFRGAGHVGLYIGHNRIVHALNPRMDVRYDSTEHGWTGSQIVGYGRVIRPR